MSDLFLQNRAVENRYTSVNPTKVPYFLRPITEDLIKEGVPRSALTTHTQLIYKNYRRHQPRQRTFAPIDKAFNYDIHHREY